MILPQRNGFEKKLLTVKDDAGGHTAQARILGQKGTWFGYF